MFERSLNVARQRGLTVGIAAIVVALDQITKSAVVTALGPGRDRHDVDLLGSFLRFDYVENRGAAFGVLRDQSVLLLWLALGVLGGLVLFYRRLVTASPWVALGVGLVGGGAIGNLIDRIRSHRGVVDFLDFGLGHVRWPVFNVADIAVTTGAILLAISLWREEEPTSNRTAAASE